MRKILRKKLKIASAGLVQGSLWITPYHPATILEPVYQYLQDRKQLIYTKVGKDCIYPFVSEKLAPFLESIYHLSPLSARYSAFVSSSRKKDRFRNIFSYLNILKDDPQLPFELEPSGFKAREAYDVYRKLVYKTDPPGPDIYTK